MRQLTRLCLPSSLQLVQCDLLKNEVLFHLFEISIPSVSGSSPMLLYLNAVAVEWRKYVALEMHSSLNSCLSNAPSSLPILGSVVVLASINALFGP